MHEMEDREMDSSNKKPSINNPDFSQINKAAGELINEGKKYANELYEEGLIKVSQAEDELKKCSHQAVKQVQKNPLTSVLIAGGIGFILSILLRK